MSLIDYSCSVKLRSEQLSTFLKDRYDAVKRDSSPSLHALSLTGLSSSGVQIIQRWLDRYGDIQTAALVSSYVPLSQLSGPERAMVKRWREGYRELLDGWGMWSERVEYDVRYMEVGRALGEVRGNEDGDVCPAYVFSLDSSLFFFFFFFFSGFCLLFPTFAFASFFL